MVEFGRYSNDLFELQTTRWELRKLYVRAPRNNLPEPCPRLGHSFTLDFNNIGYVFGGLANDSTDPNDNVPKYLNDFYAIDLNASPTSLLWQCPQTHGQPPSPRESHTAVHFTTQIGVEQLIIYGGMNGARLGDVWILDLITMNWSNPVPAGIVPLPRSLHTANLIGHRMFVFGGWVPVLDEDKLEHPDKEWKCTNTLAVLNLNTLRWEHLLGPPTNAQQPPTHPADMERGGNFWPTARAGHSAAVINKRIYIWSGRDGYKKKRNSQVCCSDLFFLETEPPVAPSGIQLVKATVNSLEISWSPSTTADRYILQIQRADHQPDASEKLGRRLTSVRAEQQRHSFRGSGGAGTPPSSHHQRAIIGGSRYASSPSTRAAMMRPVIAFSQLKTAPNIAAQQRHAFRASGGGTPPSHHQQQQQRASVGGGGRYSSSPSMRAIIRPVTTTFSPLKTTTTAPTTPNTFDMIAPPPAKMMKQMDFDPTVPGGVISVAAAEHQPSLSATTATATPTTKTTYAVLSAPVVIDQTMPHNILDEALNEAENFVDEQQQQQLMQKQQQGGEQQQQQEQFLTTTEQQQQQQQKGEEQHQEKVLLLNSAENNEEIGKGVVVMHEQVGEGEHRVRKEEEVETKRDNDGMKQEEEEASIEENVVGTHRGVAAPPDAVVVEQKEEEEEFTQKQHQQEDGQQQNEQQQQLQPQEKFLDTTEHSENDDVDHNSAQHSKQQLCGNDEEEEGGNTCKEEDEEIKRNTTTATDGGERSAEEENVADHVATVAEQQHLQQLLPISVLEESSNSSNTINNNTHVAAQQPHQQQQQRQQQQQHSFGAVTAVKPQPSTTEHHHHLDDQHHQQHTLPAAVQHRSVSAYAGSDLGAHVSAVDNGTKWYHVADLPSTTQRFVITQYRVPYNIVGGGGSTAAAASDGHQHREGLNDQRCMAIALEPGTLYRIRCRAVNSVGASCWSQPVNFKTCVPGFPGSPTSIRITKCPEGVFISWDPPLSTNGQIEEYSVFLLMRPQHHHSGNSFTRVYIGPAPSCVISHSVLGLAHVDTATTPKPAIIFRISARNEKGYGSATQVRWLQETARAVPPMAVMPAGALQPTLMMGAGTTISPANPNISVREFLINTNTGAALSSRKGQPPLI